MRMNSTCASERVEFTVARGWGSRMGADVSGMAARIGRTMEAPPNEYVVAPGNRSGQHDVDPRLRGEVWG